MIKRGMKQTAQSLILLIRYINLREEVIFIKNESSVAYVILGQEMNKA